MRSKLNRINEGTLSDYRSKNFHLSIFKIYHLNFVAKAPKTSIRSVEFCNIEARAIWPTVFLLYR